MHGGRWKREFSINEGEIDLPCDGEDYKYNRELFVSEVKENELSDWRNFDE